MTSEPFHVGAEPPLLAEWAAGNNEGGPAASYG